MTIDIKKQSYNTYDFFPAISHNCLSYLMDENELVWKLLKYNDKDAWKDDTDHPNLSKAEKGALIYDGSPDDTNFRVFMDFGNDNVWTEQVCLLRISPTELIPKNHVYGNICIAFEVHCHYKINTLSNYQTRANIITQQIIDVFNGAEIGGLGRLFFDFKISYKSRMSIGGMTPFKTNYLIMTNWLA